MALPSFFCKSVKRPGSPDVKVLKVAAAVVLGPLTEHLILHVIVSSVPRIIQDPYLKQQLLPLVVHVLCHLLAYFFTGEQNIVN